MSINHNFWREEKGEPKRIERRSFCLPAKCLTARPHRLTWDLAWGLPIHTRFDDLDLDSRDITNTFFFLPVLHLNASHLSICSACYLRMFVHVCVNWCFEPSQPLWIISGLKMNPIHLFVFMSDVFPLSGISGLSFDSTLLSPLLFFCLVLLPFLSYRFLPAGPFF